MRQKRKKKGVPVGLIGDNTKIASRASRPDDATHWHTSSGRRLGGAVAVHCRRGVPRPRAGLRFALRVRRTRLAAQCASPQNPSSGADELGARGRIRDPHRGPGPRDRGSGLFEETEGPHSFRRARAQIADGVTVTQGLISDGGRRRERETPRSIPRLFHRRDADAVRKIPVALVKLRQEVLLIR